MIDNIVINIVITNGILILIIVWICTTLYSIIKNDNDNIGIAFFLTILYGIYKLIEMLQT